MNIQTHRNSTPKALILGALFNSLITLLKREISVGYSKGQSACVSQNFIKTLLSCQRTSWFKIKCQ